MDEREIADIIERVRRRVGEPGPAARPPAWRCRRSSPPPATGAVGDGVFATLDEAVAAAAAAFRSTRLELDLRKAMIDAVRRAALDQAEVLARLAVEETGLGRVDDKTTKNRLVAAKTPGPEDLEVQAVSGANGMMITEWAPFGVVGSITPVDQPGRDDHQQRDRHRVRRQRGGVQRPPVRAARVERGRPAASTGRSSAAGGPANLVTSVAEPTIESARALMTHPDVRVLLVTGGPGVVREALKTDKRAITAGPGNPPAVVDETADLEKAGADIVTRRVVRQQHHVHRREERHRGRVGRGPARPLDGAQRRLHPRRARAAAPGAGDLHRAGALPGSPAT